MKRRELRLKGRKIVEKFEHSRREHCNSLRHVWPLCPIVRLKWTLKSHTFATHSTATIPFYCSGHHMHSNNYAATLLILTTPWSLKVDRCWLHRRRSSYMVSHEHFPFLWPFKTTIRNSGEGTRNIEFNSMVVVSLL